MKLIRKYIKSLLLEWDDWEDCKRDMYWGVGGSGVVVLCIEDNTIYMQQRSYEVTGGQGQWAFPAGGIHAGRPMFHDTPIEFPLDDNDPEFESNAFKELEEEAGRNGLPNYKLLESLITYEDCDFRFKTFIIDISLEEKKKWNPYPQSKHEWEVMDQGWFSSRNWRQQDIYFGFSPILIQTIKKYIG